MAGRTVARARTRKQDPELLDEIRIAQSRLRESIQAILRRVRVDRRWDIPYLAGYSRAGRTIYIDRHLPRTFLFRGKRHRIDPFMLIHEAVEIALLDKLDLSYHQAHLIALLAERAAVESTGLPWASYQRFVGKHIKLAGSRKLRRVPRNLNLTPYLDEQDLPLLQAMLPLMFKKWEKPLARNASKSRPASSKMPP